MIDDGDVGGKDAPDVPERRGPPRPRLSRRDVFALILRTYRASFPYMLLFVLVLLVMTWVLTELIF